MPDTRHRTLLLAACGSYLISTYLLFHASASDLPLPSWGGYLDVGLVILIVYLSFSIFGKGKDNPRYQRAHRTALNIVPLLFLGIWVFRNVLDFNILLPGLAWRTFLLLHILPYAMNLWKPDPANE